MTEEATGKLRLAMEDTEMKNLLTSKYIMLRRNTMLMFELKL